MQVPEGWAACALLGCRWRTALIVRELEQEIEALTRGRAHRARLKVCTHMNVRLVMVVVGMLAYRACMCTSGWGAERVRLLSCGQAVHRPIRECLDKFAMWECGHEPKPCILSLTKLKSPGILPCTFKPPASCPLPVQDLLNKKEQVGDLFNNLRLARQRSLYADSVVNAPEDVHLGELVEPSAFSLTFCSLG